MKFELAVLRLFFGYVCATTGQACLAPQEPLSVAGDLLQQYSTYLRQDRGLAENSLCVYHPLIRGFLASQRTPTRRAFLRSLNVPAIRDFVLRQTRN